MIRVLNLYAGIGGNRKLWENVEVIAIENNPSIAGIYKQFFPKDTVLIVDAHQYLLDHYKEFDFIWSSPPCQTHSSFRHNICVQYRGTMPCYPDMRLYQEILFLQYNAKCKWVVENVKPYYEYLIKPTKILQRHLFWSNFEIPFKEFEKDNLREAQIPSLEERIGFKVGVIKNKRQVLRNCVAPEIGKYILGLVV